MTKVRIRVRLRARPFSGFRLITATTSVIGSFSRRWAAFGGPWVVLRRAVSRVSGIIRVLIFHGHGVRAGPWTVRAIARDRILGVCVAGGRGPRCLGQANTNSARA